MAFEKTSGLNVSNWYGPRTSGGTEGVQKTAGYRNEYCVDLPQSGGLFNLFPRGDGVYVNGFDTTFATGTLTALTIGAVNVFTATDAAPVRLLQTNNGLVVQTGLTAGRLVIFYKNISGQRDAIPPVFPAGY